MVSSDWLDGSTITAATRGNIQDWSQSCTHDGICCRTIHSIWKKQRPRPIEGTTRQKSIATAPSYPIKIDKN